MAFCWIFLLQVHIGCLLYCLYEPDCLLHLPCLLLDLLMASLHIPYLPKSDVMLDGMNYKAWTSTLRVLLRGVHLWGHIDDTTPAPPSIVIDEASSPSATSGVVFPPPPLQDWKK